jgi:hypothetical protein
MTLKSFSLGIIDLLGIMLPGVVWLLLIWYIHFAFPQLLWTDNLSAFCKEVSQYFPTNQFMVASQKVG